MAQPVNIPMTFGFGRYPTAPDAIAIYRQLGLKGHNGDDYASANPVPTFAIQPGEVIHAGWKDGGYGNCVIYRFKWRDGRFYDAVHAHLSYVGVRVGQHVKAGQQLGLTGTTGASTGIHLHFAVRPVSGYNPNDGYYGYINPAPFYESQGGTEMTKEQAFCMCFMTQATRWPKKTEEDAWKKTGLEPYTWVQRHAPNIKVDQERINAFHACFITLATRWPSEKEVKAWRASGLSAYEYCQKHAPNVKVDVKEQEIRELNIKLEAYEQQDGADAKLGRAVRELVEEVS